MYYGYCLMPSPLFQWTPKIALATPEEAYRYCGVHHHLFPEVLITDDMDFTVMVASRHILYVPWPDGSCHRWNMQTREELAPLASPHDIPRVLDAQGNVNISN